MTGQPPLHALLAQRHLDLHAVARAFTERFEADGALVLTVRGEEAQLEVAASDPPQEAVEQALSMPVGYGVNGLVASNGRPVILDEDSPRNQVHRRLLSLSPGQAVARMCVPAFGMEGAVVAVVSVHRAPAFPFTGADVEAAQPFADLLGIRLHAQGLRDESESHRNEKDRLVAQAVSVQEEERRRVARDLHDGVTQELVSLAFRLSAAEASLASAGTDSAPVVDAQTQIAAARQLAELAYNETRAAISGLHSMILDDLGLVPALESLAQSLPQLGVELRAGEVDDLADLPEHCAAALYRIAQEALNNAVKHADASRAVVSLRRVGDLVVLGVTDDGVGFDVQAAGQRTTGDGHFGLSSLAERCALVGARLRIDSIEGRGTSVLVELPLPAPVDD